MLWGILRGQCYKIRKRMIQKKKKGKKLKNKPKDKNNNEKTVIGNKK